MRRYSLNAAPLRMRAQRGVVLIVALVVLVAMSLGGVAIMRSVDTATLIAGNIAFKQRSLQGADIGLETAIKWISDNRTNLNADNPGAAYFSSISAGGTRFAWENVASWSGSRLVGTDVAGNEVRYVIHRMCIRPGEAPNAALQMCGTDIGSTTGVAYAAPTEGSSNVGGSSAYTTPPRLYLRVTVRSAGPRNAVSFAQAMVLIPF